jgi:hypothetical protein
MYLRTVAARLSCRACERAAIVRDLCKPHYAEWALEHAPVCSVPNCGAKTVARLLCATHYRYALRHREFQAGWKEKPDPQNGDPQNGQAPARHNGYDSRFCGLFLNELERRGWPRYPDQSWNRALNGADCAYAELGLRSLKPMLRSSQIEASAGRRHRVIPI